MILKNLREKTQFFLIQIIQICSPVIKFKSEKKILFNQIFKQIFLQKVEEIWLIKKITKMKIKYKIISNKVSFNFL